MSSRTRNALAASVAGALLFAASAVAQAQEVKVGIILGFTGPLESITPGMGGSAELALKEVNDSGLFLDGQTLVPVRADSTCIDNAAATAAAERLVTTENVAAIMGADCSGVTIGIVNNVAVPNGVVMVSPSATSPALTDIEDNDYFFRTAPSDARQGEVLTEVIRSYDIDSVAVSYTNNDYGKGFSDSFVAAFEAAGGTVTIAAPHDDGKGDYSAEVGALAAAGGDVLVVLGYVDQGGVGIIRSAVDTGAFDRFALGDGMYGQSLIDAMGDSIEGTIGVIPGAEGEGSAKFAEAAKAAGLDPTSSYTGESYDAAALIALAMQKAGSTDRTAIRDAMLEVANAPGEQIIAADLAKGLQILKDGGDIDYVGATNVELIGPGEAAGTYREYIIENGEFKTVQFR
ncbi:MAG: ABC transporter substrate-binding protein [Neoaquamicrobium sediminum]|uniref:ABC transporter substrate-binding protein n=1 Tax=Neoaquamicrobium sediminum TaxID=1849104 RepID=UPI001565F953|nr:ABC transporter substrate-binding protein [Mesorhizobium sediminum]MBX9453756.1 ABC transporter substrate-binding protein [Mesorhizobium sp.]NRC54096.1 ABC transporter substrate-binding protein [Mesorhizobium sediminum]